ncbi:MAG TPA: glycosyltransferase family 1 protein [Anaerolineae bacterium]|nr:glycosyltransferase family 1 protein [Anaerolineae bacterium]
MPEKPTVLFYESNYYRFYGAARVLVWLMTHLQRIHPVFVAPGDGILPQRAREAGIETVILPAPGIWRRMESKKGGMGKVQKALAAPALAFHIRDLARLARERNAIGIHANSTRAAVLAGPAAKLAGVPMWWHLRRERRMGMNERAAYAFAEWVICISQAVEAGLGSPPKAVVIHDGLPADRIDPHASGEALKARLGWPEDALVVGAVGSLAPNKRHDMFIRTALALADSFPQARFLIAGHRPQGAPASYERRLHELAQPLEETGRMVFLGWVENVSEVFAAIDAFVFPSDNEGLGLVAIEAMQMGVPVVRTDAAGAEDMIRDGETGFIVPVGDQVALTQRVRMLLEDPALRERIGRAGQEVARSEFTAQRMAEKTEALMLRRK